MREDASRGRTGVPIAAHPLRSTQEPHDALRLSLSLSSATQASSQPMNRLLSTAVAALGLVGALHANSTVIVQTSGLNFVPANIVIEPGTTVRWIETSGIDHTVTEGTDPAFVGTALFNAPLTAASPVFEFTFTAAFVAANPRPGGVYDYYCLPHFFAGMVGTVTVLASPYESFCFGDGGDQLGCTPCPCSNEAPLGACGGCLNSAGTSGELQASGTPSVAGDTMRMEVRNASPNTFAVLTSGATRAPSNPANPCFAQASGLQSATLDGLRCVVQAVQRHGARPTDANGSVGVTTAGWGPPNGPPGGLIAQGGFSAGQTRHYQVVYRDDPLLVCMTSQNTTQGVSVTFVP